MAAFAPRLARLLEATGVLVVLDNLETLLTAEGRWRDPRWEPLIGALCGHGGESRVIMTSRVAPAGLDGGVLVAGVHALDLAESAALARELPGLRDLLHADDGGPERTADTEDAVAGDRELVRRVLRVVQGHPKLMELADAAARGGREQLAARLDAAEHAAAEEGAGGGILDTFFRDGATALGAGRLLEALAGWTTAAVGQLPGPAALMARFLACLEDTDRASWVIEATWAGLWRRLAEPGDPPDPAPLLAVLAAAALVQPDPPPGSGSQDEDGEVVSYRMHPGVAAAIRAAAPPEVAAAADAEAGEFWRQVSDAARQREGGEAGQVVVRAGLAAAPYLLRRQDWNTASLLLEHAIRRDYSPGTVQAALPALRAIAAATRAPQDLGGLARALAAVDPAGAEAMMREALARGKAGGDFRVASSVAGDLVNLLRDAGRLREALDLAGQMAGYTARAGLGPWTQLGDEGRRLQILGLMGDHQQVLGQIAALRARIDALPATPAGNETARPWNVRETTLDTGHSSALALGEWQQALDLNAAILASRQARGAGPHEIARTRFNDYAPLLRLGRLQDAGRLLAGCQQVFENHSDLRALAVVLGARSDLENQQGNLAAAIGFQQTALRYGYARPEPRDLAISHYNLANYLREAGTDRAAQRAHRLAAALIYQHTGMTYDLADTTRELARELREDAGGGGVPGTVAEVTAVADQTEGVRLGELLAALQPDPAARDAALAQILRTAADTDPGQDPAVQDQLQQWEPVIALVIAAAGGDPGAAAELAPVLEDMAGSSDWAALVAVLRRILDGERGQSLLDGLDAVDTAIAGQVLARLDASASSEGDQP